MKPLLYLILVLTIYSCHSQYKDQPYKIKGITLEAPRDSIDASAITPINDYHANYVVVVPYAWMPALDQPKVIHGHKHSWWGESPNGVKQTIRLIKDQQMQVLLKPQLWVGHGDYTGHINLTTDQHWQQLEQDYTNYIMTYVQIAIDQQIGMLCIGTELDSFVTERPEYWRSLIQDIRRIYKGKLTYAANWDSYNQVSFWDQLDYIGVNAYFPVSNQLSPTLDQINDSWQPWVDDLSTLSRKRNKNILFTEYGYISADYAGREPWKNAAQDQQYNQQAQVVLLQGLYDAVWDKPWFAGGFLWKHHAVYQTSDDNKRFTTQYKIAQQTVAQRYKK